MEKAFEKLHNLQLDNGSFLSFSGEDLLAEKRVTFHTTFTTSLVALALRKVKYPVAKGIVEKATKYLLTQKSDHWTFNYWDRYCPEYTALPYPDDLDDTFCALAALYEHEPDSIPGKALADIIHLLTALEVKEGGPYKTWIVQKDEDDIWKDVDVAVNINIGYFLSLLSIQLPNVDALIETALEKGKLSSPYYPSDIPLLYFLSRWYKGPKQKDVIQMCLEYIDDYKNLNALDMACIVTALSSYDVALSKKQKASLEHCCDILEKEISNPKAHSFYTGVNPKRDAKYVAGSEALTLALCLEALHSKLFIKEKIASAKHADDFDEIRSTSIQNLTLLCDVLPKKSKQQALKFIEKIVSLEETMPIIRLPLLFHKALSSDVKKSKPPLKREFYISLAEASIAGWIAYTIYDDFLDNEGNAELLPIANVFHRHISTIYSSLLPDSPTFQKTFAHMMNEMDAAHAWEVQKTRCEPQFTKQNSIDLAEIQNCKNLYGDLSQLAYKSWGHVICIAAILDYYDFPLQNPETINILYFFKHFLIARQLNDDMHDWKEDLQHGYINAISAHLFSHLLAPLQSKNRNHSHTKIPLEKLESAFWKDALPELCTLILDHSNKALESLNNSNLIKNKTFFEKLVKSVSKIADKTMKDQSVATDFISSYA